MQVRAYDYIIVGAGSAGCTEVARGSGRRMGRMERLVKCCRSQVTRIGVRVLYASPENLGPSR
jgi:hypothetical protein